MEMKVTMATVNNAQERPLNGLKGAAAPARRPSCPGRGSPAGRGGQATGAATKPRAREGSRRPQPGPGGCRRRVPCTGDR